MAEQSRIDVGMIEAAELRLAGHARRTPLLSSPFLDEVAGRRVFVKAECLQRAGSFKFRGGWSAISSLDEEERERGVMAYSSGNHAQGVALAAREHGVPAVVLMPADAPALKIANTRAYGAEAIVYDRAAGEDREEIGSRIAAERGLKLIKPFDEPLVVAGQGTVGMEIAAQGREHDVPEAEVLVCCGGGGLTSGIALALESRALGYRVRTVEPEGFDDVARSLACGSISRNDRLDGSICDAILTPAPSELTFGVMRRLCGPGLTVSDDQAERAMAAAFSRLKIVLEPGGAVALAAALYRPEEIEGGAVIVVASGGNVDASRFAEILRKHGEGHVPNPDAWKS